jgi:hypothetical protein
LIAVRITSLTVAPSARDGPDGCGNVLLESEGHVLHLARRWHGRLLGSGRSRRGQMTVNSGHVWSPTRDVARMGLISREDRLTNAVATVSAADSSIARPSPNPPMPPAPCPLQPWASTSE